MTDKIYVRDVPDHLTIFQYIRAQTDWMDVARRCKPVRNYPLVMEFDGEAWLDYPKLQTCLDENFETFGSYGWVSKGAESKDYTGVSMTYNPEHQDEMNVHASTLGTPKNKVNEFFYGSAQHHEKLKNSYFDTYAFHRRTPFAETGYLSEIIDQFNIQLIRSRISTIHAKYHNPAAVKKKWHRDERIFENIRLNVPVTSAPEFVFELEGHGTSHLKVGTIYTWDTNIAHGVYETEKTEKTRTHLVFGFSPWFRYNAEDESWSKNEFYGKHPFDMYYDGDICKNLVPKNF